jgi:hypothetical protein
VVLLAIEVLEAELELPPEPLTPAVPADVMTPELGQAAREASRASGTSGRLSTAALYRIPPPAGSGGSQAT